MSPVNLAAAKSFPSVGETEHASPTPGTMEGTVLQLLKEHGSINVKELRKHVLKKTLRDVKGSDAKASQKKEYKAVVLELDQRKVLQLRSDGTVQLLPAVKRKREADTEEKKKKRKKKEKKEKKDKKTSSSSSIKQEEDEPSTSIEHDEVKVKKEDKPTETTCKDNPGGITRLFLGNLPFAVDEDSLQQHFSNTVTHIKWITDKTTGKFYGSAFVEMQSPQAAADAVAHKTAGGPTLLGRPLKITFSPARPGDPWPPKEKVVTGGAAAGAKSDKQQQSMSSDKPAECVKLFLGNLSYEITDESLTKFLVNGADAEPRAIRWIHHADTGDFKGVGFCEFWSTDACDRAAKLNGKNLLGRPIRMDWTD